MVRSTRSVAAIATLAVVLTGTLMASGCTSPAKTSTTGSTLPSGTALNGAGATFPGPVYSQWAQSFNKVESGAKVNYQAIGSGGGVQQFGAKTVDFGATDVPLKTSEEATTVTGAHIEFPTCLGAVVVSYNLPEVKTPLKLDGKTVADIFLGKIKKWNDPAIAALNAGVTLPATAIQVVHRADGSGTTGIFTGWLTAQSPEWATKVGKGKSVQWPTGQGGNGNAGVAQSMQQSAGAIGYLELQFVLSSNLGMASIKAPDGAFVAPSVDSVALAGSGLSFPITEATNILDSKVAGAYPISSTTYILIYTEQADKAKAQTLVDFFTWTLTKGQSELKALSYAPLPDSVQKDALKELGKITSGGVAVAPSAGL